MASKQNKIEIIISGKDSGLTAALKSSQAGLLAFAAAANSAMSPIRSLTSAVFSLKGAIAGFAAGAGIAALGAMGKGAITAGLGMEALKRSFVAIAGSSQGAAKEMEFVRATADKLGLDLMSSAEAYKGLAAASMGTELQGKKTQQIFTSVAKASTTLGLSADETKGALLAMSQMISKGNVSAEELRGQLGERLPGAFQIAARAMGVTTQELDKLLQNGMVPAATFLPKFAAELEKQFGKAAAAAANSFSGAVNRITSQFSLIKAGIGEVVTNNQFFVTGMQAIAKMLQDQTGDVTTNAASWRIWAKETTLSVLQFAADSAEGFDTVYRSLSWLAGTLKLAYGGALLLGKGFQYLFEQANKAIGDTEKARYWAQAQVDAAKMIDGAMNGAAKSFDNAEQGSQKLQGITGKITQLKNELAKVKPDEVTKLDEVAPSPQTIERVEKIGGAWRNVTEQVNPAAKAIVESQQAIDKANTENAKGFGIDWGKVYEDFQKNGEDAASAVNKALDEMAKDRHVRVYVDEVSGGGGGGGYKNGGLVGQLQRLASGGSVRNVLSGAYLPGFGGGDRRLLYGEDGEVMINKFAVRGGGLKAALAFNAQKWDVVLAEMLKRVALPAIPHFATGGQVAPAAIHALDISLGGQYLGRTTGSPVDVAKIKRAFARADRMRS